MYQKVSNQNNALIIHRGEGQSKWLFKKQVGLNTVFDWSTIRTEEKKRRQTQSLKTTTNNFFMKTGRKKKIWEGENGEEGWVCY